jgi:hypothetical protein
VIRASGHHGNALSPFDFAATMTFWAGKPYVTVDYQVLASRGDAETPVAVWEWTAEPGALKAHVRVAEDSGSLQESDQSASRTFGPTEFRYRGVEYAFQSFWGHFWGDWSGENGGLAVTVRQAQQNFPKAMEVTPSKFTVSLYPTQAESLRFPLGAAKTHRMLFHFHQSDEAPQQLALRSLQFQIPDTGRIGAPWYGESEVWDEKVFEGPRSRRFEALFTDILDNRPIGMGIWNFGDEVDPGYTAQGRGLDEVVWLNNEYDLVHSLFVQYARTGERRFLDYSEASAAHWRDVDIAHVSHDVKRQGAHIAHSARHVTGGFGPSHQWVEGLLDAYHILGDQQAYQAALGIGDNILRALESPEYWEPVSTSTRELGWAQRALLALYCETREQKYATVCRRISEKFLQWHTMPGLETMRVNFMKSLTLVSLARCLKYFPDERMKQMILEETEDMIRNGRNSNGLFYYKEQASLQFQGTTALPLQLLAYAYWLSADRKYLEAGLPELEYWLVNLNGRFETQVGATEKLGSFNGGYSRVVVLPPGGKFVGTNLMPILEFLYAAKDFDLTRQMDFQLRLQ